jgi:hypothetical protein
MILDGSLALLLAIFLIFSWESAILFLLLASLVAIIGGTLALKGILPFLAAAGPPLLIIASVWLMSVDIFLVVPAFIGLVLAICSLAMVAYGWSDLLARVEMRNRMARPY